LVDGDGVLSVLIVGEFAELLFFFLVPPAGDEFRLMEDEESTADGLSLDGVGEEFPAEEFPDAPPLASGSPLARLRLPEDEDDFPFLVGKPLPRDGILKLVTNIET